MDSGSGTESFQREELPTSFSKKVWNKGFKDGPLNPEFCRNEKQITAPVPPNGPSRILQRRSEDNKKKEEEKGEAFARPEKGGRHGGGWYWAWENMVKPVCSRQLVFQNGGNNTFQTRGPFAENNKSTE